MRQLSLISLGWVPAGNGRRSDSPIGIRTRQEEVCAIQKAILEGSFVFSSFRLVSFKREDPIRDRFSHLVNSPELPSHSFSLYIEPKEESHCSLQVIAESNLVFFFSLSGTLVCVSIGREQDYVMTVVGWGQVEQLFLFDLSPVGKCIL